MIPKLKRQFMQGVAFLHRNGVAHRDLKPSNAVVSTECNLWIIDFGLAIRVPGPNNIIVEWCGTPEWMAPEIGKRDDPERPYSPIRADLWACGKMLRYFGKFTSDTKYMDQAQRLLNKDPQRRPLLDTICPEVE
jgi:serine/threonine protein kinase